MQSGIGDAADLQRFGIPVAADLPGVGRNYQDHPRVDCIWEYEQVFAATKRRRGRDLVVEEPVGSGWTRSTGRPHPDAGTSAECAAKFDVPEQGWTISAMVARPKSCGTVRLTGPDPGDPVRVDPDVLSHPDDTAAMTACVELSRDIGNSPAMRRCANREVMPGDLKCHELAAFIRAAAVTVFHSTGTAKMGRDGTSVVDGHLKVHGMERLRIADASIMPRIRRKHHGAVRDHRGAPATSSPLSIGCDPSDTSPATTRWQSPS
jgi:choline dehydrogenase